MDYSCGINVKNSITMARLISRQKAASILGMHVQTISNWVASGVLTGHVVNGMLLVDSNTVYRNCDSLQELNDSTELLNKKIDEVAAKSIDLDNQLKDIMYGELRLSTGISPIQLVEFFRAMIKISGEDIFNDRERRVLNLIVELGSVTAVSRELKVSNQTVCNYIVRFFRKLMTLRSYPDVCRENIKLKEEIDRLQKENKGLNEQYSNAQYNEQREQTKSKVLYNKYGTEGIQELSELLLSPVARKFSTRVNNLLKGMGIITFADIVCHDEMYFLNTPKFGKNSVEDMKKTLSSYCLHLGMDVQTIFSLNMEIKNR